MVEVRKLPCFSIRNAHDYILKKPRKEKEIKCHLKVQSMGFPTDNNLITRLPKS